METIPKPPEMRNHSVSLKHPLEAGNVDDISNLSFEIRSTPIPTVTYLGLIMNSRLSGVPHITKAFFATNSLFASSSFLGLFLSLTFPYC